MPPTNQHEPEPTLDPAIELLPGEPPVRVTHALTSTPLDPPPGTGVFTGLTPRLAATLLAIYTNPGDVVVDTTADLAVEGTARAGAREYHRWAVTPDPRSAGIDPRPSPASLVLLRWPAVSSTGSSSQTTGSPASGGALAKALRAGRQLARSDGHLVLVLDRPLDSDYRDRGRQVIVAARASAVGSLRRIVVVTASGRRGRGADMSGVVPSEGPPRIGGPHSVCQLVFVVSVSGGGGRG